MASQPQVSGIPIGQRSRCSPLICLYTLTPPQSIELAPAETPYKRLLLLLASMTYFAHSSYDSFTPA